MNRELENWQTRELQAWREYVARAAVDKMAAAFGGCGEPTNLTA